MKLLICFGTRPEWLKIKPILSLMSRDEYKLFFTGQHEDLIESVDFDYISKIETNKNRLDDILSSCILNFPEEKFDFVLVQGDTASALGCAIAGYNRGVKIVHLEAGLRSYDLNNPYPEESYRQMISRISHLNLCPTELSANNLKQEKVSGKIHIVGNTVLDNLISYKNKTRYTNKVLITLHRRENHILIQEWFNKINLISEKLTDIEFILPIHPNPNVFKYKSSLNENIKVVNPLSHDNLILLLSECKFIISDSGGIQEESSFLNKKVIVCRTTTERPEGITTGHLHLCKTPDELESLVYKINENYYIDEDCPYGDGHSSKKIIKILNNGNSNT